MMWASLGPGFGSLPMMKLQGIRLALYKRSGFRYTSIGNYEHPLPRRSGFLHTWTRGSVLHFHAG